MTYDIRDESDSSAMSMTPTMEEAAVAKLVHYRKLHECSQTWVAESMREPYGFRWTQTTVWSVEQFKRPLRLNEIAALAEIFDVPVSDFLRPDDTSWFEGEEEPFNAAAEAVNKFKRAAEEARDAAFIYHEAMLQLSASERSSFPSLAEIWDHVREESIR